MKKIILVLILMIIPVLAYADFVPHNVNSIKYYGIGVLDKTEPFVVFKEPEVTSKIIKEIDPQKKYSTSILSMNGHTTSHKTTYIAMKKKPAVALIAVETERGDGWYEIYLNQRTGEKGWVYDKNKKDFYTWRGLFTLYGKTTGLRFMHGVPDEIQTLYAKDSEDSQTIKKLEYPSKITFSLIRGNWMLVKAHEYDGTYNIGWLKWRNEDGSLNLFPIL